MRARVCMRVSVCETVAQLEGSGTFGVCCKRQSDAIKPVVLRNTLRNDTGTSWPVTFTLPSIFSFLVNLLFNINAGRNHIKTL